MINVPRRYESAFRKRYREIVHALHIETPHDRSEALFVAAQFVAWLECRDALTKAMDRPDYDTLNTTERKEARALRRQSLVLAKTYMATMAKLTNALRRDKARTPTSGDELIAFGGRR